MDTFETIKTMLAVRSYRKEQIPPHVVTRIVEAGRLTGSSMNTQQWDFIIIHVPSGPLVLHRYAIPPCWLGDS